MYHLDGVHVRLSGEFRKNRPNGNYTKFYPNGTIKEEGSISNLRYLGTRKRYSESGKLNSEQEYNSNGILIDTARYYFENGCNDYFEFRNTDSNIVETIYYHPDSCNLEIDRKQSEMFHSSHVIWGDKDRARIE